MLQTSLKLTKVENTGSDKKDTLHIGANRNRIKGYINVLRMRDKDTQQVILYVPAIELTSYGDTPAKAEEMLHIELGSFFSYLLELNPGKLDETLLELGWKKVRFRNKDFSKVCVDFKGELENFNIVESEVEHLALVS